MQIHAVSFTGIASVSEFQWIVQQNCFLRNKKKYQYILTEKKKKKKKKQQKTSYLELSIRQVIR